MKYPIALIVLAVPLLAQDIATPKLSPADAIRIDEFYRLASSIQDEIWAGWGKVPAPMMLVTPETEFLTHSATPPPAEFKKVGDELYARPRQFPADLQATMPTFGPPAVMVVGEPANTESKTSTPWLFTVMHEHFHQLQWAQPGYYEAVEALDLSRGDQTGMWMLNYPFPYDKPEVAQAFTQLRDLLLCALSEPDGPDFAKLAKKYVEQRKQFFSQLSVDDHKYLGFQLWQEGMARYSEVKAAEAAANYHPTAAFSGLSDYEAFSHLAAHKRADTLEQLKRVNLATDKRPVVYSFGAAEGFLLDRIHPNWKDDYFKHMLSLDSCFEEARLRLMMHDDASHVSR